MPVVAAKHHCAKLGYKRPGTSDASYALFSSDCAVINRQIGQVALWTNPSHGVCNGVEYLLLRQGAIIGDVVDVTRSLFVISRQHKTLDDVSHIAEGQRVVPPPDNYTLAILHFLGHAPKVQPVAGPKKGTWTHNNRLSVSGKEKAPQQPISLGFADTIGVGVGSQRVILSEKTAVSETIDGVRTGVNVAAYASFLGCFIEIL